MENGLVKEENVAMGAVGAFIGSIAGVIAIVLFDMLGVVASLAGVVMGYATFFMYEKFAKSLSKKGIIICVVIMLVMVLVGENLAWAIAISKASQLPVKDAFFDLYSIMSLIDVVGDYILSLVLVYVFSALGAAGIIRQKMDLIKNK